MVPSVLLRHHTLHWVYAGQVDSVLLDRGRGQTGRFPRVDNRGGWGAVEAWGGVGCVVLLLSADPFRLYGHLIWTWCLIWVTHGCPTLQRYARYPAIGAPGGVVGIWRVGLHE